VALPVQETTEDVPIVLPEELGIALFDQEARRVVGISGDEFLERYDAGDFRDWEDTPEGRKLSFLILLIPFGRRIT
jgi:hypothetical protein